jgi:acyl transferase domain-containing protein/acyl carrier protein
MDESKQYDSIESVAIVGMSGRFPGARNLEEFWQNLRDGVESISFFSEQELQTLDPSMLQDPNHVRAGAVLDDIESFDASFFGFSPREAQLMDPQHRLFLECAWEALENAGYSSESFNGQIGVYASASISNYLLFNLYPRLGLNGSTETLQMLIGNDKDYLATHVSYKLNLKGPSVCVQTACSSSLVAVCMACQSLVNYHCDMALAGGVTIRLPQKGGYSYQEGGIFSPDGHCRAFDAGAKGTIFGSGLGIVVLKRLEDALAAGDYIHAVIKGSAINNDGSQKVGYTAPSVRGQADVVAMAQAVAGVRPDTIAYIETHGTGTALGDPMEIEALTEVFRAATAAKSFCAIGSVKTNFGHLESAAGIASLIKTVLALKHKALPPSLHFEQPNPEIDFANSPFYVNARLSEWPDGLPRRAGVSSFGIGGTNAHVVVEEAPPSEQAKPGVDRPLHLLSLSAKTPLALKELAARFEHYLAEHPADALPDVCFTANTGRSHFSHRLAIVAESSDQARQQLAAFVSAWERTLPACSGYREPHSSLEPTAVGSISTLEACASRPKVAFLFTGQYAGMGKRLFETQPTFRKALQQCDLGPWTSELGPSLFAVQYALAQLWRSWGIEPAAVMGQDAGEYAAACVAGVLTLEDAVKFIRGGDAPPERLYDLATPVGRLPRIPMISSESGVQSLFEQGYTVVEIGPSSIRQGAACLPSLHKGRDEWQQILESLAALYVHGVKVDWSGFDRDYQRRRLPLPTYPFQRERYWIEAGDTRKKTIGNGSSPHALTPLLGQRLRSALKEIQFESQLSANSPAFLNDHRVYGLAVLPATAFLEIALAGAANSFGSGPHALDQVVIREPLVLPENESRTVQLIIIPEAAENASFQILSLAAEQKEKAAWTLHATGKFRTAQPQGERLSPHAVRARCQNEISGKEFYQNVRQAGFQVGASFQAVEQLWWREGEVLGQIRLPQPLLDEAGVYRFHPVLMDACWQIFAVLHQAMQQAPDDLYMPIGLDSLRLYGQAGTQLWSHLIRRPADGSQRETLTADLRLFDQSGQIVAEIDGLHMKRAPREALLRQSQKDFGDWLYEIKWRPKAPVGQSLPADYLPAPSHIARQLEPELTRLSSVEGAETYQRLLPELEALSFSYALNALRHLGCEFRPAQRLAVSSLVERLGIAQQHHRLLGRMLEMLREEGILTKLDSEWEVCRLPDVEDPEQRRHHLSTQYPAGYAELTLLGRCGKELADVLTGRSDPLQILFPDGALGETEKLYQDSPPARIYNTLIQQTIATALQRLPEGRTARILEIGAGTGGTTQSVLPSLASRQTEYVFTDISPLFTTRAQEKFCNHDSVRYQVLDIERDPASQGFGDHQYDIILAANVLHATRDLRQTLEHVKQLLAPEGLFVLLEGTGRQRWVDLVFGLTEGWWRFADTDLRPDYPLISEQNWLGLLQETGFTETAAVSKSASTIILGRGPTKTSSATAETTSHSWLIFSDEQGVGQRLAEQLRARGEGCVLVFPGESFELTEPDHWTINPTRPEDFLQLIRQTPMYRGVVHLWSLSAPQPHETTLANLEASQRLACGSVLHLVQALLQAGTQSPPLWLVTRGAQPVGTGGASLAVAQTPLWGLGKVIALEHPDLRCVRVDLDPESEETEIDSLLEVIRSRDKEDQIAIRRGMRHVSRLTHSDRHERKTQHAGNEPVQLVVSTRGVLDNLKLQPVTRRQPKRGEVEIEVLVTGLIFRDVLNALGMYPGDAGSLGSECAGRISALGEGVEGFERGDAVIALAAASFSTFVTTPAALVVKKPEHLGFEEAATIPVNFLTAYYGLHHLAKMQAGDRVLIHTAAGGVGLAAVQLAQQAGAEIFATAGKPEKREFLRLLGIEHVMNSRSLDFAGEIMKQTKGEGIDIVLNSLTGEFIPKSLSVLRRNGRFLEIGKTEIWDDTRVAQVNSNVTYFSMLLDEMMVREPALIGSMLRNLMEDFKQGILKPLPRRAFPIAEAVSAFRYMAQARHIGKIVVVHPHTSSQQRATLRSDGTYLITGGLGGLGLVVARWMLLHGARHLALVGRGTPSDATRRILSELEPQAEKIAVIQADVSEEQEVKKVLAEISATMPPLRGIIHGAGVLDDGVLARLEWGRFAKVLAPKVAGGWNLHTLTRDISLDFFVLFSSAVSLFGSPGQGNHAAANAFLDGLAHYRRAQGLPALSINWGAWGAVGAAATAYVNQQIAKRGIGNAISPDAGLQVLEQLMQRDLAQVAVLPVDWPRFLRQLPPGFQPLLFSEIARESSRQARPDPGQPDLRSRLEEAPARDRPGLVLAYVQNQVVKVLGLDPSKPLDPRQPLNELGLDSLMAIELRNALGITAGATLPSTLLFDYPTVEAVAGYLGREVFSLQAAAPSGAKLQREDQELAEISEKLEGLSEGEIAALLAEKLAAIELDFVDKLSPKGATQEGSG